MKIIYKNIITHCFLIKINDVYTIDLYKNDMKIIELYSCLVYNISDMTLE